MKNYHLRDSLSLNVIVYKSDRYYKTIKGNLLPHLDKSTFLYRLCFYYRKHEFIENFK